MTFERGYIWLAIIWLLCDLSLLLLLIFGKLSQLEQINRLWVTLVLVWIATAYV